jgi:hypothetical protein
MLKECLMPTDAGISNPDGQVLPLTIKKKEGRPLVFDAAAQAKFLEGIALGIPRVRCAHLAGVPWPTASAYIQRHPAFQQRLDTAEAEAEAYFASSIKRAAAKDHPIAALAWLGRRRPEDWAERGRVDHGHAHVHALTPGLAATLAQLNIQNSDDPVMIQAQTVDHQPKRLSDSRQQTEKVKKVRRYSKRPTRPRPTGTPPPASATHIPPLQISAKNKKALDATTTETNNEGQEGAQQAA